MTNKEKKLTLRLPGALHRALVEIAEKDRRSLHAEIIVFLEEAVAKRANTAIYGNSPDPAVREAFLNKKSEV